MKLSQPPGHLTIVFPLIGIHPSSMPAIHVRNQEVSQPTGDSSRVARARVMADRTLRIRRLTDPVLAFVALPVVGVLEGAVAGRSQAGVGLRVSTRGRRRRGRAAPGRRRRGDGRVLARGDADGGRLREDGAEGQLGGGGWGDGARGAGAGRGVEGRRGLLEGDPFGGSPFRVVD